MARYDLAAIQRLIVEVRGHKVIVDADLAPLYGVPTRVLNQAVSRNAERFPADFVFQLTDRELEALRSQNVISNGRGGRRYRPYVFTEHGTIMAANVLSSVQAVQISVLVVRAFVRLRELLATHKDLARRLDALEQKYNVKFKVVFDAIRALMKPVEPPRRRIGFHPDSDMPIGKLVRIKDPLPPVSELAREYDLAKLKGRRNPYANALKKQMIKGFDRHLRELLAAHPEVAHEYEKLFAELPLPARSAIIRRRRKRLSHS